MTDLAEFLLARIKEDHDREWRELVDRMTEGSDVDRGEAERRIRNTMVGASIGLRHASRSLAVTVMDALPVVNGRVLRAWALPYADHSDYRQEWRP